MSKTADLPGVKGKGVGSEKIPAIEKACGEWRSIVNRRMKLTKSETEAKQVVMDAMKAAGINTYPYVDDGDEEKILKLTSKEGVKLVKPESEDDDEGHE